jgi:hypothetical protein
MLGMVGPPLTPFEEELAELFGEAPPEGARAPTRNHVTFQTSQPSTPLEAAEDLVRHIRARNKTRAHLSREIRSTARAHTSYSGAVTVRVSWQGQRFHTVKFASNAPGEMLASHKVGPDLSLVLHEWLTASDRFVRPCWRTADAWELGEPGSTAPI